MDKIYIEFGEPVNLNLKESMYIYCDSWTNRVMSLMTELLPQIYNATLRAYEASPVDLDYLIRRCNEMKIEYEINRFDNKSVEIEESVKKFEYKTKPYKHQEECVKFGMDVDRFILGDEMGLGKALSLDTTVCTPNGFIPIADIHKGDMVFNEQGNACKVTAEYYNKNVNMYEITFSDGAVVKCCEDHLWCINTQHGKKVVPTKWFSQPNHLGNIRSDNLIRGNSIANYWIDRCLPINFPHKDVLVDPYVLGCLLGDGCLCSSSISICNNDADILNRISNSLPSDYILNSSKSMEDNTFTIKSIKPTGNNIIVSALKSLSLMGTTSHTKFIPNIYKYNDKYVRLNVLRGLLDTDGYASNENTVIYTTVSKQLADDVKFLVESLGGIVSTHTKIGKINDVDKSLVYNVTIRYDDPQELFYTPCKSQKLHSRKFKPKRAIVSVKPIGKEDAKCITVDNPTGLYVIKNFVITHNTKEIIDLATLKKYSMDYKHCLIICCVNGLKWNWEEEIGIHSNEKCHILGNRKNKRGKWSVRSTKTKLEDVLAIGQGDFDNTYFFITNIETLRDKTIASELAKLCDNNIINMIAVDEVHRCSSNDAQQSQGLIKLKSESMVAMTGSPIMNSPLDLYVPLYWLGYDRHTFDDFKNHFCRIGKFNSIVGYKNMEQIQDVLKSIMIRRLKDEVLDLPDKVFINEYVEMNKEQEKIYNEVVDGLREDVDLIARSNNPLANLIRLRQATGHTSIISSTVSCSAKFDRCCELVDEYVAQGHKIIIFSNWTAMTDLLKIALAKYNPAVIVGETKDSQEQKQRFMEDPNCKVVIGTIAKLGTGYTLTAADIVIFIDQPWTWATYSQAVDRAHRIGAKNTVTVINLLTKNTIDERINDIVMSKKLISETMIDNLDCLDITKLLNFLLY